MLSIPLAINLGKPYHSEPEVQVQGTGHKVHGIVSFLFSNSPCTLHLEPCTGILPTLLPYALRLTPAGS